MEGSHVGVIRSIADGSDNEEGERKKLQGRSMELLVIEKKKL